MGEYPKVEEYDHPENGACVSIGGTYMSKIRARGVATELVTIVGCDQLSEALESVGTLVGRNEELVELLRQSSSILERALGCEDSRLADEWNELDHRVRAAMLPPT